MDNPETSSTQPVPDTNDVAALQQRIDSLQRSIVSVLFLLVILGATLAYYMHRQARITRAELDAIRPQAEAINATYQRLVGPNMDDFARKLAEFGAKNPDFAPILNKYGVMRQQAPVAPAPAGTGKAPAPAPAKK